MVEVAFSDPCCDICGSSEFIELIRLQDGAYNECKTCGLIYANPIPDNYNQLNNQTYTGVVDDYIDNIRTKRKRYHGKLKRFSHYRLTGNFLEIGCNVGGLLKVACEMGWNVKGLDICAAATKYAREQLGLDVFTGTVEQAEYPENYFDVICTNAVLEHTRHPFSTLTECVRILRPGGIFYANTVNWDSYTRRLLGPDWKYLNMHGHIHLYTPENVNNLCQRVGFENVKIWSTGVRVKPRGNTDFQTPWHWHLLKGLLSCLTRITNKGDHIEFIATKLRA
jgi:SAM-dependent methyltransferase